MRTAHVWTAPAAADTASERLETVTGTGESTEFPFPS
jgi:hypothetical protein